MSCERGGQKRAVSPAPPALCPKVGLKWMVGRVVWQVRRQEEEGLVGRVVRLRLQDFMCHRELEW